MRIHLKCEYMMICPTDILSTTVIDILAHTPSLTVAELKKKLEQRKVKVTLQHVYRVVTKLEEGQVLLKHKKTVSLNLLWLSYVELFAHGAREKLLQGPD